MPRPPKSFFGFVGQPPIINSVSRITQGCKSTGKPFPHTLLIGSSGYGKTHIAQAISEAMGTSLHTILCGRDTTRTAISSILQGVRHGDILFVDEIHGLKHTVLEFLYPAMDERKTLSLNPDKPSELSTDWISIKPVTVIAATDRAGELRNAFRRRCPLIYAMQDYTIPELREIAMRRAKSLNMKISPQSATLLARICRGTPRNLRHMLEAIQLYFPKCHETEIAKKNIEHFLSSEGIDINNGLSPRDLSYLSVLYQHGKSMSVQSLALAIGADEEYISHELEPSLIRIGYIVIDKGGRSLTEEGETYIKGLHR